MKPKSNTSKSNPFLRSASIAAILALGGMHSAQATNYWWDGTSGNWEDLTNWSTTAAAGGADPTVVPLASVADALTFNTTGTNADTTIYLNGNRGGLNNTATVTINNTGTTTFSGGTSATAVSQALSSNGITVSAGAGTVTFSGGSAAVGIRMGTGNVITNNSSNLLAIGSSLGSRGTSGTPNFTLGGTGEILFSGVIGQGGTNANVALTKTGAGTLTLSGANLYNGGTTISTGTLTFLNTSAKSTAGTANNHVFAAGTTLGLGVATSGSFYTSTDITNAFALTGVGTGNLTRISITATTNVGIDTTAGDFEHSASIAGAPTKGLAKLGANTLTLSGSNTYTGVTTVRAGTLKVVSGGIINDAATSGGTGIVIGGGTLDIDGGTVNFLGATALAVGDNTTAGNVIVRTGANLNLTGNIAIGQGASGVGNTPVSTFTQSGGTTTFGVSSTLYLGNYRGATMNIQGGTLTSSSSANIGVRGNSTMTISGANTAVTFTQINLGLPAGSLLPTADLNLNGGTLTLGANGITKTVTDGMKIVSFDGGTLKASATSTDFVNADSVFVKTGGATIDTNTFDVTIDNALLQSEATTGALTKSGAGTLTLTNTNTYTGPTAITGGTLALNATGSIADSSSVAIAAGAKLETVLQTTYAIPTGKTVTFGLNAAGAGSSGQINAAGLDISAATVAFDISGPLDDAAYVLATYTSKTGAAFSSVPTVPGYTISYTYNGGTQIALVASAVTGYSAWAAANANNDAANLDSDDDGVDNGVEYFMGQTGSSFTASPTSFTANTATWTNGGNIPAAQYGTQFVIQTSTDLVDWTSILADNPNLNNQTGSVSFTLTGSGKQFVRVVVTPN